MDNQVFDRIEKKYLITPDQKKQILRTIQTKMEKDKYHKSKVLNVYFDTDNYDLIIQSIDQPLFKHKIRARNYVGYNRVFLEIKTKLRGKDTNPGYKRRIMLTRQDYKELIGNRVTATEIISRSNNTYSDAQIAKEIDYFKNYYGKLQPYILILYDRIAFKKKEIDLRITFDRNTRYRATRLSLSDGLDGTLLLEPGHVLMEIKSSLGFPRWLVDLLNEQKSYKRSFSKVGEAHKRELILSMQEEKKIV